MRRFTPLVAFLPCLLITAAVAQDASPSRGERSGRSDRGDRGDRGDRSERRRRRDSGGFGRTRDGEGDGSYELRGFFGSGTDTEISLRLSGTDKAYWIKVGEREKDIYVEKVDPVVGTAVIITGGVRYKLRLAGEIPASARQGMQTLPDAAAGAGGTTVSQGVMTIVRPGENGGQPQTVVFQTATVQPAAAAGNNPPPAPAGTEPAPPPPVQNNAPNDAPPPPAAQP